MRFLVLRSLLVVVAVLAFRCSALEDESDVPQREATFDLSEILEGEEFPEAGPDLIQREVTFDLPKFFTERGSRRGEPDMTQVDVTPDLEDHFKEIDRPVVAPRSFKPELPFPPARPSLKNFPAICLYGEERPRYSRESLPQTGYSYMQRQGDAINRIESLYSFCCQKNGTEGEELSLCCAQQAWEYGLNHFCEEEFSIKTKHYHCCKKTGGARWNCFEKGGKNPSYQPSSNVSVAPKITPEPGFSWNPSSCQWTNVEHFYSGYPKVPDISFPPGRPTSSNIGLICSLRKLRPRYQLKCLPSNSFGWLARQAKAINRMEKAIRQCCKDKNEVLTCADGKWQVVMDRYCKEEHSVKDSTFPCCDRPAGQERYGCFASRAPHPRYDSELTQREIPPVSLKPGLVCDSHKLLTKKFSVPLPVESLVSQCCHLPTSQRTPCVEGKLDDLMERMCVGEEPRPPAVSPDCCLQTSHDSSNCLFKLLLNAITKATRSSSMKKKCPLA